MSRRTPQMPQQSLRRRLPSANALFFFEAVARSGSLTRAAEELCVTQPAVSRMLGRLESHLGVKLLERFSSRIELTDEGRLLARHIANGLGSIEAGIEAVRARPGNFSPVSLSLSVGFATHWLLPRLGSLRERYPMLDLHLQLNSGRVGERVIDVDLCVGILQDEANYPDRTILMPEVIFPVQGADMGEGLSRDTVLVMEESEFGWHQSFVSLNGKAWRSMRALHFNDYAVVIQAALRGHGYALGWLHVVATGLADGTLLPVGDQVVVTRRNCCIIGMGSGPSADMAGHVRDWIVTEMGSDLEAIRRRHPHLLADVCVANGVG